MGAKKGKKYGFRRGNMKCICVNDSDVCCYIYVSRDFIEKNVESSLIRLEMMANGVGEVRVVGKYKFDSDQRK